MWKVDKYGKITRSAKAAKTLPMKVNFNSYYKLIYTIQYRIEYRIRWCTLYRTVNDNRSGDSLRISPLRSATAKLSKNMTRFQNFAVHVICWTMVLQSESWNMFQNWRSGPRNRGSMYKPGKFRSFVVMSVKKSCIGSRPKIFHVRG